uniref:Uncharacterized protein n=1 Tax=Magallana gigas TaxID=29159 RepID=K1QFW0_MAGGI
MHEVGSTASRSNNVPDSYTQSGSRVTGSWSDVTSKMAAPLLDQNTVTWACKTYYIYLRDTERRKLSGREKEHTHRNRRQSRRRERAARLKKTLKSVGDDKLGDFDKKKVMKVFTGDYMSSEDSEEDEAGEFSHFCVRRMPWQKEAFQNLKDRLEEIHKESLTPA